MDKLTSLLEQYQQSHQNPTNKKVHFVCVPLILFSILGLLFSINVSVMMIAVLICMIYYIRLSLALSGYMLIVFAIMARIIIRMDYVLPTCIAIFIISWIFQFIGHKIEGKKPSFFQDLQFLLIGPLWITNKLTKDLNSSK